MTVSFFCTDGSTSILERVPIFGRAIYQFASHCSLAGALSTSCSDEIAKVAAATAEIILFPDPFDFVSIFSPQCSKQRAKVFRTWTFSLRVVILGMMTVLTSFLPFSPNPLHAAVIILTIFGFAVVAALCSPLSWKLVEWLRLLASKLQEFPRFREALAALEWYILKFRFQLPLCLLFVGMTVVLQPQYNLRYTLASWTLNDGTVPVLHDGGMSVTLQNADFSRIYGASGNLFSFEKCAFEIALLNFFFSLCLDVPILHIYACSAVHFIALLAQIPRRSANVSGDLSATIFVAFVMWLLLPVALVGIVLLPLWRCTVPQLSMFVKILKLPPLLDHVSHTPIRTPGERASGVGSESFPGNGQFAGLLAVTPASNSSHILGPAMSCLQGVTLGNSDVVGQLRSPAVTVDMHGVIIDVNEAFCSCCHVDSAMLLHRSFESVLEWFDVDEVSAIMAALRRVARGDKFCTPGELRDDREGHMVDLCLSVSDNVLHVTPPERVMLRGYGTGQAQSPSDSAAAVVFSPRHEPTEGRCIEGRFAVVLDIVKFRHTPTSSTSNPQSASPADYRIVLRQPLSHSSLELFPFPMFLFQKASGAVLMWNSAMVRMTGKSSFEVLGADAYHLVLSNGGKAFVWPTNADGLEVPAPIQGDCKVQLSDVGTIKTISFSLYEWPSQPHARVVLCVMDRGASRPGTALPPRRSDSQQALQSLLRIVADFNRQAALMGNGAKQHLERLELFADAMISFARNLALSQADRKAATITTNSDDGSGLQVSTTTNAAARQEAKKSEASAPQLPGLPLAPSHPGAWGRLVSQDPMVCDSCVITTPLGKDFTFGRSARCTLTIADAFVSSVQFSIVRKPGEKGVHVVLVDHSVNGSFVNVRKVGKGRSCILQHNDLITFRLSSSRFFLGFVFQMLADDPLGGAGSVNTSATVHPPTGRITSPESAQSTNSLPQTVVGAVRKAVPLPISPPPSTPSIPKKASKTTIEWKIGEEVLGRGGNAEVYLGINLTNGKLIAVKRVPLPKDSKTLRQYQSLQEEITMLSTAVHPNIVHYYGSSQSETHLNILLEFVPGGSLRHLLDNFGALGDGVILSYLEQTLAGLAYLHERNIVHSDIKTANILVTDKGQVKLTDFGTATLLTHAQNVPGVSENANSFTVVGTLLWMAPELVRGETAATKASDIWSLGCAIVEMITSEFPWSEYDFQNEQEIANLLRYVKEPPEVVETKYPLISQIAKMCLQLDPAKRPTCRELLDLLHASHSSSVVHQRLSDGAGTDPSDSREVAVGVDHMEFNTSQSRAAPSSNGSTAVTQAVPPWLQSDEFAHFVDAIDLAHKFVHQDAAA